MFAFAPRNEQQSKQQWSEQHEKEAVVDTKQNLAAVSLPSRTTALYQGLQDTWDEIFLEAHGQVPQSRTGASELSHEPQRASWTS